MFQYDRLKQVALHSVLRMTVHDLIVFSNSFTTFPQELKYILILYCCLLILFIHATHV